MAHPASPLVLLKSAGWGEGCGSSISPAFLSSPCLQLCHVSVSSIPCPPFPPRCFSRHRLPFLPPPLLNPPPSFSFPCSPSPARASAPCPSLLPCPCLSAFSFHPFPATFRPRPPAPRFLFRVFRASPSLSACPAFSRLPFPLLSPFRLPSFRLTVTPTHPSFPVSPVRRPPPCPTLVPLLLLPSFSSRLPVPFRSFPVPPRPSPALTCPILCPPHASFSRGVSSHSLYALVPCFFLPRRPSPVLFFPLLPSIFSLSSFSSPAIFSLPFPSPLTPSLFFSHPLGFLPSFFLAVFSASSFSRSPPSPSPCAFSSSAHFHDPLPLLSFFLISSAASRLRSSSSPAPSSGAPFFRKMIACYF
ncbi:hypothetical protein FSA28_1271 [Streptococcus mutans]|nr:hypothetical protein FSA28_1271 [Streptococcus mutans]